MERRDELRRLVMLINGLEDQDMTRVLSAFLFLIVFCIAGATQSLGGDAMELSSSAFKEGAKIPKLYVMPGAGGKNVSLPFTWKNPPQGTKSFALSIVDPHPVARNWVHWIVVNIPAGAASLDEDASRKKMPPGSLELKNSYGDTGYGGPQPPKGTGDHPYVVTLYALDVEKLELGVNTGLSSFKNALKGKVLAEAAITGYYSQ